jgi:hypothetical protein
MFWRYSQLMGVLFSYLRWSLLNFVEIVPVIIDVANETHLNMNKLQRPRDNNLAENIFTSRIGDSHRTAMSCNTTCAHKISNTTSKKHCSCMNYV